MQSKPWSDAPDPNYVTSDPSQIALSVRTTGNQKIFSARQTSAIIQRLLDLINVEAQLKSMPYVFFLCLGFGGFRELQNVVCRGLESGVW